MGATLVRRIQLSIAALGSALVLAGTAAAATNPPDEEINIAGLDVAIWRPPAGGEPYPLVLFSHGVSSCKDQSSYLMEALAEHGFLVAAPDHADNKCPIVQMPTSVPPGFFADPSPGFYVDRRDDLR